MTKPIGKKFNKKRMARKIVFSALYATKITEGSIDLSALQKKVTDGGDADFAYAKQLLEDYLENKDKIDAMIQECQTPSKRSENTDVEIAILQMAVTEMLVTEISHKVAINEAIEIAKEYGAEGGYKFINAVLDSISNKIQGREV
ncbi:MAG: transcription antitermination factor NusB [Pseudomonadota bacterium]|nr:transcription antitermination factor NusB [Pseudomonadota bacterium]